MFSQGGSFIIKTVFEIYTMALILRVFLQYSGANYYNPVSQLIIKITDPVVKPLKSYIPGFKGIDLSIVVLIFACELIKVSLLLLMNYGSLIAISKLFIFSLGEGFSQTLNLVFYLLIGRVLLSWVQSPQTGPLQEICYTVTEPFMAPIRRIMPPISGFDLSPLVVILLLQLVNVMFLSAFTL